MDKALENLTGKFVDHYASSDSEKQEALDPTTFFAFAELILELIKKIQECRGTSSASVKNIAASPKFGQRLALRRHLKDAMGRQEFRHRGDRVEEALISAALDADDGDIEDVWASVE
jgi:hypothetical protein